MYGEWGNSEQLTEIRDYLALLRVMQTVPRRSDVADNLPDRLRQRTREDVDRVRADLERAGSPAGDRSIGKVLGISATQVRRLSGKVA